MTTFHERLARLSDQVRALDGGEKLALDLMRLAGDIDAYLDGQRIARHGKLSDAFVKWHEFLNASVDEAHAYGDQQIAIERRKIARSMAADPRWQGGYADALKLVEE